MSLKQTALPWLGLSLVVIALDQLTKQWALQALDYAQPVPVFWGLNWTLLYNYGAAFSFLSDQGGWQRWFFTVLAVAISALVIFWMSRTERRDWRNAVPFALIVGGALGNAIDRLRFGYVVDFIDVYYGTAHWPAFNVADSAITVGAVMLIVLGFSGPPADRQKER